MKKCIKCGEIKSIKEFRQRKDSKNSRRSECKKCISQYNKDYSTSLKGKASKIYSSQNQSSKRRGHDLPKYTRNEFIEWILSNEDYLKLHSEWVKSGYEQSMAPSVDRINDYEGYSFDNVQVITWGENHKKWGSDSRRGINNKKNKAVIKMDLKGNDIEEYHSISHAAREMGLSSASSIQNACVGKCMTSAGFKWKFA